MTILLAAETLVLVLLALLVAGLLRSHAEILVRLSGLEQTKSRPASRDPELDPSLPPVAPNRAASTPSQVQGTNLRGEPVQIGLGAGTSNTLLAFLSSGCETCAGFWQSFGDAGLRLPGSARLVIVTKDSELESPSRLRKVAPPHAPVLMSSAAWEAFDVPVYPYFVLIDGATGGIAGEGAAGNWKQMQTLLEDAVLDREIVAEDVPVRRADSPDPHAGDSHPDRIRRADRELLAAGIHPDDPSLWPGRPIPDQT